MTPAEALADLALTVESVFVPFSQSRNKAEPHKTLNWKVTVKRNGRDILTTDYGAGIAHCPGYNTSPPSQYRGLDRKTHNGQPFPGTTSAYRRPTAAEAMADYQEAICAAECESGVAMENDWQNPDTFKPRKVRAPGSDRSKVVPILPDTESVIYSLVMDSSVLDCGGFECWADEFGFETDSRKAESIYRECLDLALKLRAGIGEEGLRKLQDAFQDY